ncbi:MAG: ribonuclease R [Candidatus Sumerlaeaceae bacterium]|nr:ribonuclease R [Candidatus Sumerlaeaceae bacterium]
MAIMEELRARILDFLAANPHRAVSLNELAKLLGLPAADKRRLRAVLRQLIAEKRVEKLRGRHYRLPSRKDLISGILRGSSKGFGFVVPDDEYILANPDAPSIYVPMRRMGDALHGDRVLVRIRSHRGESPEGQIVDVLERGTREVVGTFYYTRHGGRVLPRNERFTRIIVTPRPPAELNVHDGDIVIAEIVEWTQASQPLIGRVREKLGDDATPGIDVTVIIREAGIDPEFPPPVTAEAERLPRTIAPEEIRRRRDFRDVVTFTMDGLHAKDFDDALSVEKLANGNWLLGVHIADVSWYVREGSQLDREAYERATSIYPVDRVVPMLPERLSNDLCSLRPNEDRLTLSCLMEVDGRGRVGRYWIYEGIIRSRYRLVYEDVQQFMEGKAPAALAHELEAIREELETLYELRRVLTAMRHRRGALDLDIPETEIVFAPDGSVADVVRRERLEAHRVVEEAMILANEVVASHLFNLRVPSIYRVHEEPDVEKLRQLMPVLAQLGVRFPAKGDITTEALQVAIKRSEEVPGGHIARRLILRSMMRAHYCEENVGHYGLASTCYTHFTSPIRRYPDLIVHRILRETFDAGAPNCGLYSPPRDPELEDDRRVHHSSAEKRVLSPRRFEHWDLFLPAAARHCSERERRAEEVENRATTAKALEYMLKHLGDHFNGVITSVVTWGFFVELAEKPIEGLVHIRRLEDDFYEYDEERMALIGRNTGKLFRVGQEVVVAVERIDLAALELDLLLVSATPSRASHDGQVSERRSRPSRTYSRSRRKVWKPNKRREPKRKH